MPQRWPMCEGVVSASGDGTDARFQGVSASGDGAAVRRSGCPSHFPSPALIEIGPVLFALFFCPKPSAGSCTALPEAAPLRLVSHCTVGIAFWAMVPHLFAAARRVFWSDPEANFVSEQIGPALACPYAFWG